MNAITGGCRGRGSEGVEVIKIFYFLSLVVITWEIAL